MPSSNPGTIVRQQFLVVEGWRLIDHGLVDLHLKDDRVTWECILVRTWSKTIAYHFQMEYLQFEMGSTDPHN